MTFSATNRLTRAIELGIIVDEQDEWLLSTFTWRISNWGYVLTQMTYDGRKYPTCFLHHLIIGQPIDGSVIDHKNRNKLDNRRANLWYTTRSENSLNSSQTDRAEHISPSVGGFSVQILRHGKRHYVGYFRQYPMAEKARDDFLQELKEGKF